MNQLPNDCRCSNLTVSPANWNTKQADINKDWFIKYRFYEGAKVLQVKLKGMNTYKELKARQQITSLLLDDTLKDLLNGYNPNKKDFITDHIGEVHPNTLFFHALQYALDNAPFIAETKKEIEWTLRNIKKAAEALNYLTLSISEVRTRHIKMLLDKCKKINPELSNNSYNVFRKYLYKLFKILKQYEAVEMNPVTDIEKLPIVTKIRKSLSPEDQRLINKYLQKNYSEFHRFLHIFFHSGTRIKELMRLQVKHVYLKEQEFLITSFKGGKYAEALKPINDEVLPLWRKQIENAKPEDYVFTEGLLPGATQIKAYQIGKRWYRLIKKPLGVTADFYSLKHSKITAVSDAKSQEIAAQLAGHSSEKIIAKVYDLNADKRRRDELKRIKTPFGK